MSFLTHQWLTSNQPTSWRWHLAQLLLEFQHPVDIYLCIYLFTLMVPNLFPFISDISSVKSHSKYNIKKVHLCARFHDPTFVTHKYFGNIVAIPWCLVTYSMVGLFKCCHKVLHTETCKDYKKQRFCVYFTLVLETDSKRNPQHIWHIQHNWHTKSIKIKQCVSNSVHFMIIYHTVAVCLILWKAPKHLFQKSA